MCLPIHACIQHACGFVDSISFLEVEEMQVGWMPWRNQESTFVGLARERKVIQPPASPDTEEADELIGDPSGCDELGQVFQKFTMHKNFMCVFKLNTSDIYIYIHIHVYICDHICIYTCIPVYMYIGINI